MRRLAFLALAFAFACFFALYLPPLWIPCLLGALSLCAFFLLRKRPVPAPCPWILLGLAFGFLYFSSYSAYHYLPAQALEGKTIHLEAEVTGWPTETDYGIAVPIRGGEASTKQNIPMRLFLDQDFATLRPGDTIQSIAYLSSTSEVQGKATMSFRSKGIYLFAKTYGAVTIIPAEPISPRYYPAFLADQMRGIIGHLYSGDHAAFLEALLLGTSDPLSPEDEAALSRTGLSHVVSVSGMHISFLAGALLFLLGRKKTYTIWIQVIIIFFFAAVAGNSPGAIRAAILCSATLIAPLLRRTADSITSLSAALLLLLLWNPFSIANAGLQFSFAATFGIYLVGQPLYQYMRTQLPSKWRRRLSLPCSVLAVSLGSMLFTLPLTAWYFDQFSLIAPLSNLLTHWSISFSFLGGVLSICLGAIWQPLGLVIAAVIKLPLSFFLFCARTLSKLPFAALPLQSSYYLAFLLFLYCLILCYVFFWRKGMRRPIYPLCACVLALCLSTLLTSITTWKTPFSLTVLDVGQGQSIALASGRHRALIDCGGSKQAGLIASNFLLGQGVTSLDLLILTHYHEDHTNGVPEFMSRIKVHTIAIPDSSDPNREAIEALALQYHSEIWYINEESHIPFGLGELVLYPPLSQFGENEACLSVLPTFHQWEALITGDMSGEQEAELLYAYPLPDIELFVLGHHGSRYAGSSTLLETLSPELSVVSVGHNSYGHPAEDTLKRLSEYGSTLYRTDQMGHITISVYD